MMMLPPQFSTGLKSACLTHYPETDGEQEIFWRCTSN